jgi:zinc transport system substrate-binding protein
MYLKTTRYPVRFISFVTIIIGMLSLPCAMAAGSVSEKLVVYSVNYPLAYFARRIGGEHVDVHLPVPAGEDPAFWMPDSDTITAYQQADLVLLNGAGYAKWVDRVSLSGRKRVNTSASFRDAYIPVEQGVTHQHGPGGDHSHAGTAFTTWLDFSLAAQHAQSINAAMSRARPAMADVFEANKQKLVRDLEQLDRDMQRVAGQYADRPMLASHPVYQYLARRYKLNVESVTWEPDLMPDPDEWRMLSRKLQAFPADVMLWERQPLPETRKRLQQMGVKVVVFDPVMNAPSEGDFLTQMQANVNQLLHPGE